MYRILVPIDTNEERTTAQTATVVDLLEASADVEVTLLHVFDDRDEITETSPSQLASGAQAKEKLLEAGATVAEVSRTGDPAEAILGTARKIGANVIVLGGRKRSPLGALVFGSVSQDVIREARVPVTIAGSVGVLERPSHRCVNCGEAYYTDPATDIGTCRECGGVHVERLRDEPAEQSA